MTNESGKRFSKFFGRFRDRFEKLSESVVSPEENLIHAVIERIDIPDEAAPAAPSGSPPAPEDQEEVYEKLLRRLQWQLSRSGIGAEEVIRTFSGEVQAVLLYKSYEKFKGGESNLLRERFIAMGWKNVQPNLWVLPPNKTPGGAVTSEQLKIWLRRKLAKPFGKDFDYAFPVVAVLDLKQVTADKKGIRKMPTARTIFNVLEPHEVVPASHLYTVMKDRGFGVRNIILSGSIPFLASPFASTDELIAIQENADAIVAKLKSLTGSQSLNLQDIANLGPDLIAQAFGDAVAHGRDLAQRLIVEAQFWMRYLGGTVPSPGPTPAEAAAEAAAEEEEEKVQQVPQGQWVKSKEEPPEEEPTSPVASQEAWVEPAEKEEGEAEPQEEQMPKPRADKG